MDLAKAHPINKIPERLAYLFLNKSTLHCGIVVLLGPSLEVIGDPDFLLDRENLWSIIGE
ncbi:uncharacterized protein N7506_007664 [Penicillium brevicompactum]|uniref:uncharacterized protein n=1 Tax=Penicillium brevicompactum TaxID=5074 RepID=UPI0025409C7D|nr:uncharacterized protein N7506_007664 [Penicillium brevicompactum]KAJ5333881.1 hypothetical protein N7506_007664 [Penicillium brevicompactum]